MQCVETGKIYHSIQEASRETGTYAKGISRVCKGLQESCKGLHWKYVDTLSNKTKAEPKRIRCIETDIIYDNASDAGRKTGIGSGNLLRVCKGERKTAGGYHWEFIE